jgi:UDP-3-O-[3-hydroxymyristoyl] N-acetylglucosamine deacetylase
VFATFELSGAGVHTGALARARVAPGAPGTGIRFATPDGELSARVANLDLAAARATDLTDGTSRVRTVEHLLAALSWYGERDVRVAIDGPEIPILDGSAAPWCAALARGGAVRSPRFFPLAAPLEVARGSSVARLEPLPESASPRYRVELEFPPELAPSQHAELRPTREDFVSEIAPARTFALAAEVPAILGAGLGRGGSLDNALVIGPDGPLNPGGERLPNEPARHKLLDALGDLALLGAWPWAELTLLRPGHRLLHALVAELAPVAAEPAR